MARRYHTLLLCTDGQWGVEFGDYDRATVEEERTEYRDRFPAKALRIVTTGPRQADINAKLAELNG